MGSSSPRVKCASASVNENVFQHTCFTWPVALQTRAQVQGVLPGPGENQCTKGKVVSFTQADFLLCSGVC